MKYFRMVYVITCVIVAFIPLLGCSAASDVPLTVSAVTQKLEKMAENNTVLIFEVNPVQTYAVSVTAELLDILELSEWEGCSEIAHDDVVKRIYFDLQHEDVVHYSRVVIFSDGTAFIQVYDNEGYNDKAYYCFENTQVYNNIISYILTYYSST